MSRPSVATTSPSQSPPLERECVDHDTASRSNIRLATTAPDMPPAICAATYAATARTSRPPNTASASVTTGLRWAPDTGPNARMRATSPPAVAAAFSNSWRPVSCGDSRCAAIPEPTTTATRNAVPQNSARARRASGGRINSTDVDFGRRGGRPSRRRRARAPRHRARPEPAGSRSIGGNARSSRHPPRAGP